jgi:hypothetical protein
MILQRNIVKEVDCYKIVDWDGNALLKKFHYRINILAGIFCIFFITPVATHLISNTCVIVKKERIIDKDFPIYSNYTFVPLPRNKLRGFPSGEENA